MPGVNEKDCALELDTHHILVSGLNKAHIYTVHPHSDTPSSHWRSPPSVWRGIKYNMLHFHS